MKRRQMIAGMAALGAAALAGALRFTDLLGETLSAHAL